MEGNKLIPQIENCGLYSSYNSDYKHLCDCKTCLNKRLKISVKYGNIESTKYLLNKFKFESNILNGLLSDALYSGKNSVNSMEMLLQEGADSNFIDLSNIFEKKSILYKAIEKGDIEIIQCLLTNGSNPNLKNADRSNRCCLYAACNYHNLRFINKDNEFDREIVSNKIIDLLMNSGLNIDESSINIMDAIESLNINLIAYMLNKNYYSNNIYGSNPFHFISSAGIKFVRKNGINMVSLSDKNVQIFNMILESQYKDTFDKPDNDGVTPLHVAATSGNVQIVKCLLECGANPNSIDKNGSSIFASCSKIKNQAEIKALLLCSGANINDAEYINTLPEVIKDFTSLGVLYCLEQIMSLHLLDASTIIDIVESIESNSYKKEQPVLFDGKFYCRDYEPYFREDELPLLRQTNGPPTSEQIERDLYFNKVRKFVRNHYRKIDNPNELDQDNQDNFDFDALIGDNQNNAQVFNFDALLNE